MLSIVPLHKSKRPRSPRRSHLPLCVRVYPAAFLNLFIQFRAGVRYLHIAEHVYQRVIYYFSTQLKRLRLPRRSHLPLCVRVCLPDFSKYFHSVSSRHEVRISRKIHVSALSIVSLHSRNVRDLQGDQIYLWVDLVTHQSPGVAIERPGERDVS